jgi:alkylation response protein AidB-like acyl-CoA dehydrogenase
MTASVLSNEGVDAPGSDVSRSKAQVARLLARLDAVAPALEAEAEQNEQLGKLTDRTLALLREAEVPAILLPTEVGGLGMYPGDALRVAERLAAIDGAIGWIGGNWSTAGVVLSYFQPEVSARMLENGLPLFGLSGAPSGKAVPVEGGYRLTGAWQYGSGDLQADYIFCSAIVVGPDGPSTPPQILSFGMRGSDIASRGNWDTLGLRGTGSIDFAVADLFVPDEMAVNLFTTPPLGGRPNSGGMAAFLPFLHSGFALGIGRRILDELIELAQVPSSRGTRLADTAQFRTDLAHREAAYRSARALVHETWGEVDARLAAGEALTRRDHTLLKLAMVHLHEVVREVAVFAFNRGSGTTLRAGALQRRIRDALAGCQHLIVQTNQYSDIAWELIGAPEDLVWSPIGLVQGH